MCVDVYVDVCVDRMLAREGGSLRGVGLTPPRTNHLRQLTLPYRGLHSCLRFLKHNSPEICDLGRRFLLPKAQILRKSMVFGKFWYAEAYFLIISGDKSPPISAISLAPLDLQCGGSRWTILDHFLEASPPQGTRFGGRFCGSHWTHFGPLFWRHVPPQYLRFGVHSWIQFGPTLGGNSPPRPAISWVSLLPSSSSPSIPSLPLPNPTASEQAGRQADRQAGKQTGRQANKQARTQESKQNKQASRQASNQASAQAKQARKQTTKQTHKQSKQASKQTNIQANRQENSQA